MKTIKEKIYLLYSTNQTRTRCGGNIPDAGMFLGLFDVSHCVNYCSHGLFYIQLNMKKKK